MKVRVFRGRLHPIDANSVFYILDHKFGAVEEKGDMFVIEAPSLETVQEVIRATGWEAEVVSEETTS